MIVRIVSYFIFFVLISVSFIFLSLAILEWGGISKFFLDKVVNKNKYYLHKTTYYGQILKQDPYKPYIVQHLHPYYLFGMNWMKSKNKKYNNEIVSLDDEGFRHSLIFKDKKNDILILGGSSAFGIGSSSNEKTISSLLSSKTKYNAINRAYSAWNSHQELLALIKYDKNYKYSVSFTGVNDFSNFCSSPKTLRNNYADTPENFLLLADYFDDLRGKPILTFEKKFKKFLIYNFPNTKKIYKYIIKKFTKNNNSKNNSKKTFCGGNKEINKLVDQFLKNQLSMRRYSNSIGAEHWVVIQPMLSHHKNNNYDTKNKYEAIDYYVSKIMSSNLCKKNCLNLSNYFEKFQDKNYYMSQDNSDLNVAVFIDESHFLDHGTEKIVTQMIETIKFN
tara:strand:+ start:3453 stop:4622 length:1170 start_codon:yes stop_codon:yes gene_type:complete